MNKNYFLYSNYSNYTTKNTNMFFTTPIMKKLKARNTVQQYLRRNNLRIDNITSIREIVKETRSGMVFNTLVPEDSKVMKNCTSQVDGRYIDGNLRKVKKRFDKYFREENERFDPHDFYDDILLLTDTRTQERVGFAITQYGECNDMPSTHALKLICALPGYGELLLCSYLFTAKQQQDYGILELAGHFTNMRGLCLYNKLGFREDMLMKASHINHPSNIWVRESSANYFQLYKIYMATLAEYTYRYGKIHGASKPSLLLLKTPSNIKDIGLTEVPQAMPEYCKVVGNPIQTVSETKSEIGVGNSGMFIDLVVIHKLLSLKVIA